MPSLLLRRLRCVLACCKSTIIIDKEDGPSNDDSTETHQSKRDSKCIKKCFILKNNTFLQTVFLL